MTRKNVFLSGFTKLCGLFLMSCSAPLEPFVEEGVVPAAPAAVIESYEKGLDYLVITGIDGVPVKKSSDYTVKPGLRKIEMATSYKGLMVDEMSYKVRVHPGKRYRLAPWMSEIDYSSSSTGTSYKAEFMPLFLDAETGKQLYPK